MRRDGAAVVMAQETAWLLRSGEGGAAPWWKGRWRWTREVSDRGGGEVGDAGVCGERGDGRRG